MHERREKTAEEVFYLKSPFSSFLCRFLEFNLVSENFLFREVMDLMNTILKHTGFFLFERFSMLLLKKCSN